MDVAALAAAFVADVLASLAFAVAVVALVAALVADVAAAVALVEASVAYFFAPKPWPVTTSPAVLVAQSLDRVA